MGHQRCPFQGLFCAHPSLDICWLRTPQIRNFSSIHKIDRSSGQVFWGLGTIGNDFSFTEESSVFTFQHNFHILEDAILVFSNELTGEDSRVIEYDLDEENLIAHQKWSFTRDPSLDVSVLGDVTRMESGDTHINWSMRGVMDRVSPEGLRQWEVQVSLGSAFGYSSLGYLRRFPFDCVKIDRSFLNGLGTNQEQTEIVRAIVGLGRTLGIEVIAEGIETSDQLNLVRDLDCRMGQGFLFARPSNAAQSLPHGRFDQGTENRVKTVVEPSPEMVCAG